MGWKLVCLNPNDEDEHFIYEFHRFENGEVVETDCGGDSWCYGKNSIRNYYTDWNEIYKAVKNIVQTDMQNFTEEQLSFVADQMYLVEKCFTSYSNDNTCYDAFLIVGETIEFLNTIK